MTQQKKTDPEFVKAVEELAEVWESSLYANGQLSRERAQTCGYSVRQFIKWLKAGQGARLPRINGSTRSWRNRQFGVSYL